MLCKKLKKAREGLMVTNQAFEELSKHVSDKRQKEWSKLEQNALEKRGDTLSIYDVNVIEGQLDSVFFLSRTHLFTFSAYPQNCKHLCSKID